MATVVLDAGHGGYDSGAVNGSRYEKNDTLRMTLAVGNLIRQCGINVVYTRDNDTFISLADRANLANNIGADLFVSFHRNASDNPNGNGFENYIAPTASAKSRAIATEVYNNIASAGIFANNRGLKEANYYVIKNTKMPAMLLELGFITNDMDNASYDEKFNQMATIIANTICKNYGTVTPPISPEPPYIPPTPPVTPPANVEKIKQIQRTLNDIYGAGLTVDGLIGPATRKALIKAYQMQIGVTADGVFGPNTKRNSPIVKNGSRGNVTYLIQAALIAKGYDITADGIFGNATENALADFQRKNGLSPDGIFGPNTAEKLFTS